MATQEKKKARWSRTRVLGFGVGVGVVLFLVIACVISPVETDISMYWKTAHRVFGEGVDPYRLLPGDTLLFCQINLMALLFLWLYWRRIRCAQPTGSAGVMLVLGSVAKPHYGLLALAAGPKPG